jgi:acetyl coenzyme A synthetase (ADP forming)-like protein
MPSGASPDAALDALFRPRSVIVVGASDRPGSVGASVFRNLLRSDFRGVAYPVNPSWRSISGVRCYPTVADVPEPAELGVVIVPAPAVGPVIDQLAERGVRGVIVISSGFREVGGEGIAREADLVARVRRHGMSLVGPNCFGLFTTDPEVRLNATFSASLPPPGNIAFVSQSGALGAGILAYAAAERIGLSRFVSVGNRAGVDECDLLRALADDERTKVILLYIEGLANGRRFLETAREITSDKPILVIKSGRTPAGERAAMSHTGSLARSGRDRLYDAVFEQCGVLRLDTLGELFRSAKAFASGIRMEGPRLAVLTNSGGPGIVAADAAVRAGLQLPPPSAAAHDRLVAALPSIASFGNPIDTTADVDDRLYREALDILLAEEGVDGVLVISTPTGTISSATVVEAIVDAHRRSPKGMVACLFGVTDLSGEMERLERSGVPAFTFPEEAVGALGILARYRAWRVRPRTEVRTFPVDRAAADAAVAAARARGTTVLPEYAARSLVAAYGIRFPTVARVTDVEAAVREAETIGYPVVLKVASPDISHKTDVGGVAAGIGTAEALRRAYGRMETAVRSAAPAARVEGYEVQAQVVGGKEVLVGTQRDPDFGPIVVFGMGGIYVEVLRDVTFRLAPLVTRSAQRMIESTAAFSLLTGVRGEKPSDLAALAEVIERISQLAVEHPEISEIDVNPLLVLEPGKGAVAVDARIVLAPP